MPAIQPSTDDNPEEQVHPPHRSESSISHLQASDERTSDKRSNTVNDSLKKDVSDENKSCGVGVVAGIPLFPAKDAFLSRKKPQDGAMMSVSLDAVEAPHHLHDGGVTGAVMMSNRHVNSSDSEMAYNVAPSRRVDLLRQDSSTTTVPPPPPENGLTRSQPLQAQPGAVPIGSLGRQPSNSTIQIGGDTVVQSSCESYLLTEHAPILDAELVVTQSELMSVAPKVPKVPPSGQTTGEVDYVVATPLNNQRRTMPELMRDWRVVSLEFFLLLVIGGLIAGLVVGLDSSKSPLQVQPSESQFGRPSLEGPASTPSTPLAPSMPSPMDTRMPTVDGDGDAGTAKPTGPETNLNLKPSILRTFRPTRPGETYEPTASTDGVIAEDPVEGEDTTEPPIDEEADPPTDEETETPTEEDTDEEIDPPTEEQTETPTEMDTDESDPPTEEQTETPTEKATDESDPPTEEQTETPTEEETEEETDPPTDEQTETPTEEETEEETDQPTEEQTDEATNTPTEEVTDEPTEEAIGDGDGSVGDDDFPDDDDFSDDDGFLDGDF